MMNKVSTQDRPSPRIVNERNHGIDLFRVLLALMVLSLHFNAGGTGKVLNNATEVPWKWIGNCFMLSCSQLLCAYKRILYVQAEGKFEETDEKPFKTMAGNFILFTNWIYRCGDDIWKRFQLD